MLSGREDWTKERMRSHDGPGRNDFETLQVRGEGGLHERLRG